MGLEGESPGRRGVGGVEAAEEGDGLADAEARAIVAGGEVVIGGGEARADGLAPSHVHAIGDDQADLVGAGEGDGGAELRAGGDVTQGLAEGGLGLDGAVGLDGDPDAPFAESEDQGQEGLKERFAAGEDDALGAACLDPREEVVRGERQAKRMKRQGRPVWRPSPWSDSKIS